MKPKTLILMLVAVACGLVAAFLASQYQGREQQAVTVPVVVAALDLPAGTMIKEPEKMLIIKPFMVGTEPAEGLRVSNPEDLRGKVLARSIDKNMPVTSKDLSMSSDLFKPAPPGYRAVTIKVNLESSVAGFILPSARVDLLCTTQDPKDARRNWTITFLENVLVLAVNTLKEQPKDTSVVSAPTSMTLAVKPEDVQRIILAQTKGNISIALRRPGETEAAKPKPSGDVMQDMLGGPGSEKAKEQTVKVWVARKTLLPQDEIDNPETFFELVNYPQSLAINAFTESEKDQIKGRLSHFVPAGYPVTKDHFVKLPGGKTDPKRPQVTVMWIQEGGKQAVPFWYENGKSRSGAPPVENREAPPAPKAPATPGDAPSDGLTERR